jgi:hypothetical protein
MTLPIKNTSRRSPSGDPRSVQSVQVIGSSMGSFRQNSKHINNGWMIWSRAAALWFTTASSPTLACPASPMRSATPIVCASRILRSRSTRSPGRPPLRACTRLVAFTAVDIYWPPTYRKPLSFLSSLTRSNRTSPSRFRKRLTSTSGLPLSATTISYLYPSVCCQI